MVLIASKHDLQPEQLVDAFVEALENKKSYYGNLKITCRTVNRDSASFLITKEGEVVWQASVNLEMITNPDAKVYIKSIPIPTKKTVNVNRKVKIGELEVGMKGIEVTAEVTEIPPARLVNTKWGTQALVSNAKIADETGTIRLGLWNNQIKTFHVGDVVEIKNCSVSRFRDEPQLRIARKGTLSAITQQQEGVIQFLISG